MKSTSTMIERLDGCKGTGDLSPWEESFVSGLVERLHSGKVTSLSEKQIESLERLFKKHFAD